jgi:site-specific recombinase XerD
MVNTDRAKAVSAHAHTPVWAEDALARYLSRLAIQRRLSPHTVAAYRSDLGQFADFCDGLGLRDWGEVDRKVVRQYLSVLDEHSYSRRSIARKASAVRSFFTDQVKKGALSHNAAAELARPRLPERLPQALSARVVRDILDSLPAATPIDLRDRAIIELLYSSGLRVSEVASLSLEDIGFDLLTVAGKGGKVRAVPVGGPVARRQGRAARHPRDQTGSSQQGSDFSSCSETFVRHPSPRRGRRPAGSPGAIGSFGPCHHPDLHFSIPSPSEIDL